MKKILIFLVAALLLLGTGIIIGVNLSDKWNLAGVDIENRSGRVIMSAIVSHEKGSAIAANIKKNHSQRVRFFTHGPNYYTIRATFDDNKTVYSQARRPIRNGETAKEIVDDSTVTANNR